MGSTYENHDGHKTFCLLHVYGLENTRNVIFEGNKPWKCNSKPDELIAKMRASCKDLKNASESATYFLGNRSAEEYVNMTFEMVDAVRDDDNETFAWLQEATTVEREILLGLRLLYRFSKGKCYADASGIHVVLQYFFNFSRLHR